MFTAHLSNEIKKWLKSMLYLGVPGDIIFDNHTLSVEVKYPLFTLLVFDTHYNGLSVAWIISSSSSASDIQSWMEKLRSGIYKMDPTWRPTAFMVDDVVVEINAIRDVGQSNVETSSLKPRDKWSYRGMSCCGTLCKYVIKVNMLQQHIGPTIANGTSNQLENRPCSHVDIIDVLPKSLDRHEDNSVANDNKICSGHVNENIRSYQTLAHKYSTILQNMQDNLLDDPSVLEHTIMLVTSVQHEVERQDELLKQGLCHHMAYLEALDDGFGTSIRQRILIIEKIYGKHKRDGTRGVKGI
eukprot:Gb_36941 [translate_table: standard]